MSLSVASPDLSEGWHGTISGYGHHGCRCDHCRAAKAAYQRARGDNIRAGRRADQKRRADENLRHLCAADGCDRLVHRQATLCRDHENEQRRTARDERYRVIAAMWNDGASMTEIAAALGITRGNLGYHIDVMRREGWDVPYRHHYPARKA